MLQQTQVERVVPRYLKWLERWPTVAALGEASPAAVIREWQGLGYNRRGVNLHRAARQIAAEGWPADLTELPGVGPYTAAAVGNFALGRDVLPVDTNVSRIQERTGHRFSALRNLSPRKRVSRARPPLRTAAQAVPVRGLVPPAPSANAAPGRRGQTSIGGPRPEGSRVPGPGRPSPGRALWKVRHTSVTMSDTGTWPKWLPGETPAPTRIPEPRNASVTPTAPRPTPGRGSTRRDSLGSCRIATIPP